MPSKNIPPKRVENGPSGCLTVKPVKQPEQGVKCPRCDSMNTKFCYYNNHSLTQPRYFCKGCRRYWTKGGALRTIPFGGGYRRRKISNISNNKFVSENDYSTANGLELFQGLNMDFQLDTPTSVLSNSSMGSQELKFTLSSIESTSSINQDLYWKLQQQRLAMLFGGQNHNNTQKEDTSFTSYFPLQNDLAQIKRFDDVEYYCSKGEGFNANNLSTEWLFDSSYSSYSVDPVAVNNCGNNRGIIEGTSSWNNGMQGWSDFNQCGLIMP